MLLNPLDTECGIPCLMRGEICQMQEVCLTRKALLAVLSSKQRSAIRRYVHVNGYCEDNSHWVSIADVIDVFRKCVDDGMKCSYCNKPMVVETKPNGKVPSPNMMTLDHRISLMNGGSNRVENIVFCCVVCNKVKGNIEKGLAERQQLTVEDGEIL